MEGHISKRRRVYSVEPHKIVQAMFTTTYVNHLVPSLTKINKNHATLSEDNELLKNVRYEVDKALAMSVSGFAWSQALKEELGETNNAGRFSIHEPLRTLENRCSSQKLTTHHSGNGKNKKFTRSGIPGSELKKEADENQAISNQLMTLKSILPGGNYEMGVDELLNEVGSYIVYLQLQIKVLHSLVDTY